MSDYNDEPTLEERMESLMPFRHEPPASARYAENADTRGKCSICNDQTTHYQKNNPKIKKPYYFKVFAEDSIFRGDDKYEGKICKQCLRDGKIDLVTKPNLTTKV